jgi:hypothetical protein
MSNLRAILLQVQNRFMGIEEAISLINTAQDKAVEIKEATDAQLCLMYGELTAQEIRTIRATVNYVLSTPP